MSYNFFICLLFRFLNADQFYRRGDLLSPSPGDQSHRQQQSLDSHKADQIHLLQSISTTLSEMQRQLTTITEQNIQRDNTLYQLEQDIKEMKGCKRQADQLNALETPKAKRSHRTPPGLSVSKFFVKFQHNNDNSTFLGLCAQNSHFL